VRQKIASEYSQTVLSRAAKDRACMWQNNAYLCGRRSRQYVAEWCPPVRQKIAPLCGGMMLTCAVKDRACMKRNCAHLCGKRSRLLL